VDFQQVRKPARATRAEKHERPASLSLSLRA